jgi:hypothetical protein
MGKPVPVIGGIWARLAAVAEISRVTPGTAGGGITAVAAVTASPAESWKTTLAVHSRGAQETTHAAETAGAGVSANTSRTGGGAVSRFPHRSRIAARITDSRIFYTLSTGKA